MEHEARYVVAALLALLLTIGGANYLGGRSAQRDNDRWMVNVYCSYGVQSERQYDTCREKVTADYVRGRSSEAAKFAKGDKKTCGRSSGPFCHDYPYED